MLFLFPFDFLFGLLLFEYNELTDFYVFSVFPSVFVIIIIIIINAHIIFSFATDTLFTLLPIGP